jgi:nucleoside-specific outer membrane channel protein Tsx
MLIPEEIIKKIKSNVDPNYKDKIDWSKKLAVQNLQADTINIIGYFNYNFWCDTDDKKRKYREIVYNNKYRSNSPKSSNLTVSVIENGDATLGEKFLKSLFNK